MNLRKCRYNINIVFTAQRDQIGFYRSLYAVSNSFSVSTCYNRLATINYIVTNDQIMNAPMSF
jgi:hypothetical protein